jgi:hypothetical protein
VSETITVAIIVSIPPTLVALGALIIGLRNSRKVDDAKAEIVQTKDGVFELGKAVDGRLKELLEITKSAATAEGHAAGLTDGIEQERTRSGDDRVRAKDDRAEGRGDRRSDHRSDRGVE